MSKHSMEGRSRRGGLFGRRREPDSLFERSFRSCLGCGADVYFLAEDCRDCGSRSSASRLAG